MSRSRALAAVLSLTAAVSCAPAAKPSSAPPPEPRASSAAAPATPPIEGATDGGTQQGPVAQGDAGSAPSLALDDSSSDSTTSTANLDAEASSWVKTCTASLEKARTEVHAAGADADATSRIISQASADGTVVILLTYASDRNKYGWLEATATLWDHRVEQTRGWDGTKFPAPLNLIRHEGRAGASLLAFKEVPPQARKDFERIARAAVDHCLTAQPRVTKARH